MASGKRAGEGGQARRGRTTRPDAHAIGLFLEASMALVVSAAIVRFLPFRRVARLMARGGAAVPCSNEQRATAIALAVERGARRLPLRLVCFQQGLAAHWMLRRRGIPSILHYGIAKDGQALAAHVWVSVGDTTVIGGPTDQAYRAVAHFPD